jgi:hypothetical protein
MYNRFLEQLKLYSLPYDLCITGLQKKYSKYCLHVVFVCLVGIVGKKQRLLSFPLTDCFLDETECVHYTVGTEYFNIMLVNFRL